MNAWPIVIKLFGHYDNTYKNFIMTLLITFVSTMLYLCFILFTVIKFYKYCHYQKVVINKVIISIVVVSLCLTNVHI